MFTGNIVVEVIRCRPGSLEQSLRRSRIQRYTASSTWLRQTGVVIAGCSLASSRGGWIVVIAAQVVDDRHEHHAKSDLQGTSDCADKTAAPA